MIVAITGANGFIGSELIRTLIRDKSVHKVYAILRSNMHLTANERFQGIIDYWQRFFTIDRALLDKIVVIDWAKLTLHSNIIADTQVFYHCAASTDLSAKLDPSRLANLYPTQRLIRIARNIPQLQRFVYFSTAFVLSKGEGRLDETYIPQAFNNGYEQSKFEAEQCVAVSGLPFTIIRPSIVVGNSEHGYIRNFKIIYAVLRMYLTGRIPRATLDGKARADIVPVNYVVASARVLAQLPVAEGQTYNVCAGDAAPSPTEIFAAAVKVFALRQPKFFPQWVAYVLTHPLCIPFVNYRLREVLLVLRAFIPYLGSRSRIFAADKVHSATKIPCPQFAEYSETIFKFCRDSAWAKRSIHLQETNSCITST